MTVNQKLKAELDRRMENHRKNPKSGYTLAEVDKKLTRLLKKKRKGEKGKNALSPDQLKTLETRSAEMSRNSRRSIPWKAVKSTMDAKYK